MTRHCCTDWERAGDELAAILTAALERLDRRDRSHIEALSAERAARIVAERERIAAGGEP